MKSLLYIGNFLPTDRTTATMSKIHGKLLEAHFRVYYASGIRNKFLRLAHMLLSLIYRRNQVSCVVISVYSTLNFYYAWASAQLCRLLRKPYITYLHGGNLPARLSGSPRLSRQLFAHAHANIAPSAYLHDAFETAGFHASLIPNFIQIAHYTFKCRTQLQPRFLWVRSFEKTYRPEMTIAVFSRVCQDYPEAQLCMVGPDKDGSFEHCKALAKTMGIDSRVKFTGILPKNEWLALSDGYDIFISTTDTDNTPVSIIEAMALGLPVVSTRVGGVPYLVTHLQTGMLSPAGEVDAMVSNIQVLLNTPEHAASIANNAREKAMSFDWKSIEPKWLEVLNGAMK